MIQNASADERFLEIVSRIDKKYGLNQTPDSLQKISAYLMVDMYDKAFSEAGIQLPPKLKTIDIGVASWYYAYPLVKFLQGQGVEELALTGVECLPEFKPAVERVIAKLSPRPRIKVNFFWGDIIKMEIEQGGFNLLILNHPCIKRSHCERWGVQYHPPTNLFQHLLSLLGREGVVIYVTSNDPVEQEIVGCFSNIASSFFYSPAIGRRLGNSITEGFFNNEICICRYPWLNLPALQEYEKRLQILSDVLFERRSVP